ncbi:DUF192 domain-containing protein [Synechococcus sp. CS-1324]|uniref:DUF192 domain-containing protein n=1 Tax=Synechococcus sp. CS-1324 TaxID=2847980 RepID=UPI000DB76D7E|nr:DUF192 domain-containing protein [Synechococcus sp. CS-1324]MCT0229534.1 DUF192 domain-containing protein [Synechococcus sp. CS-1324]PZV03508.1 MAG: DUF192 domain-containing protein [Cyanobium sp.]
MNPPISNRLARWGALQACLLTLATAVGADQRAPSEPPQFLPIEAEWCLEPAAITTPPAATPCLQLEVPRTPRQYAWGMMGRPPLGALRGMWFRFEPASPVSFWMHRTLVPLDMVFLRGGRVIAIEASAPPCPRLPCPSYGPAEPADGVVELDGGEAARLGIRLGSAAALRWRGTSGRTDQGLASGSRHLSESQPAGPASTSSPPS